MSIDSRIERVKINDNHFQLQTNTLFELYFLLGRYYRSIVDNFYSWEFICHRFILSSLSICVKILLLFFHRVQSENWTDKRLCWNYSFYQMDKLRIIIGNFHSWGLSVTQWITASRVGIIDNHFQREKKQKKKKIPRRIIFAWMNSEWRAKTQ